MERLMTPVEAAELLRVELDTVYTWVSQRRIPFQKVGRALRFSPRALAEVVNLGMINLDGGAAYIDVPNFLKYNEPQGPNSVVKAWGAALDLVPECELKIKLVARCRAYLDGKSDAFRDAIADGIHDA